MTIDEAIAEFKERAEDSKKISELGMKSYIPKAKEEEQIAEWLEELKFIRQWKSDVMYEFCKYDCNSVEEARHNGYNKAIDDFVKEVKNLIVDLSVIRFKDIEEIAEQLKVGGKE